jgi:tetraacyldisaccharide 4'-kinase
MTSLRQRIERVMMGGDPTDPAFSSPFEWFLYAGSKIYGWVVQLRVFLYHRGIFKAKRLPCKVISIGNIAVGGTGKTPMVCYVANLLRELKYDVAVISRGYGGSAQVEGGVVSNGKASLMDVQASGDEPQLLGSKLDGVPVLVGKDRYRTGTLAIETFGTTVLIMDDGFQHLPLRRDLDLLLVDSLRPFGNGYCLPRGILREPPHQIRRASAVILTRWTETEKSDRWLGDLTAGAERRPVFRCCHVPDSLSVAGGKETASLDTLRGRRVFVFSGIVRNDSFLETVLSLDAEVVGSVAFGDHHRYTDVDLELIWDKARRSRAETIITTEKDLANILTEIPSTPELLALGISISFGEDKEAFENYVKEWASSSLIPGSVS